LSLRSTGGMKFHHLVGGFTTFIALIFAVAASVSPASEAADGLLLGEAYFMMGNFAEASDQLKPAIKSATGGEKGRLLYLMGRISILTGDPRQGKEYFERAMDIEESSPEIRWMSMTGVGDALLLSGSYEDSIRRYREAFAEAPDGVRGGTIELKMALAEHAMGREEEARSRLVVALGKIPVLKRWLGREDDFYQSIAMTGLDAPVGAEERYFVRVGPVKKKHKTAPESVDVPVSRVVHDKKVFLEFGPFPDPVEAMIFSETAREIYNSETELITR